MTKPARVFYVGMIATDGYGQAVREKTYAGAAAHKMLLVARALRSVGQRAIVVSLPFVGTEAKRAGYGPLVLRSSGVPAVFLATLRSKYLRKLLGPFLIAGFLWQRCTSCDTVVVYNHSIEYALALFVLRVRRVRLIQDIEDAPVGDEPGIRGLLNRLSFVITFRLTAPRKMVVAEHVAKGLNLRDYVVIRGVASEEQRSPHPSDACKWRALLAGAELKVHFGGTLIKETGVDLFCEAVELLARNGDALHRPVHFSVTGVGELDKIRRLEGRIQGSRNVRLDLLPAISKADYSALIRSCHASLSLKRPESGMSQTTFPSKVLEITAAGVALVSTRLGDVVSIFDEASAVFLCSYRATALAEAIVGMASNPRRVERVAKAGHDVCHRNFSLASVGKEMTRLL
jgi:glycosyltransferase involved in cell wall biosynthesis